MSFTHRKRPPRRRKSGLRETRVAEAVAASTAEALVERASALAQHVEAICATPETKLYRDAAADDEPPFDPPDLDDELFRKGAHPDAHEEPHVVAAADRAAISVSDGVPPAPLVVDTPAPAISIYARWERPEIGEMFAGLAHERLLARARIKIERGGLDAPLGGATSPDLFILDTTLPPPSLLARLDAMRRVVRASAKIMVIGAVNDIGLLRELARRGVEHYLLAPIRREDLVRAICGLYADADTSRVIAVVGARGGIGASSLARNLAWSIAERQDAKVGLVDLDLCFSMTAFDLKTILAHSIADALAAPERIDDALLSRIAIQRTPNLQIFAAPATLQRECDPPAQAVAALIKNVRRTCSFVVLDVPHRWNAWVRQTLLTADEILVVAAPDLTSMRNTKNILDLLKAKRAQPCDPFVVLTMVGEPGRPEIAATDFADSVGVAPAASFAFDPALFGLCAIKGETLAETAPHSKTAAALDVLASALTGCQVVERKPEASKKKAALAPVAKAPKAKIDKQTSGERLPFTFAPVRDEAPLDLVQPASASEALLEAARRAALAETQLARKAPRAAPARGRPGSLRTAAALLALGLCGAWYVQHHESAAASIAAERSSASADRDETR